MKTILVDFNTGTDEDHVSLATRAPRESMRDQNCNVGDRVIIDDGEVRAEAVIVTHNQKVQARVDWSTAADLDEDGNWVPWRTEEDSK